MTTRSRGLGGVRAALVVVLAGCACLGRAEPAAAQATGPEMKIIYPNVGSYTFLADMRLDGGGTTIVGYVETTSGQRRVIAWDDNGNPGATSAALPQFPSSFSDDGSVIAWVAGAAAEDQRVMVHVRGSAPVSIGVLSGYTWTVNPVVSGNGQVVFAVCGKELDTDPPQYAMEAVRWTADDGLEVFPIVGEGAVRLSSVTGRRALCNTQLGDDFRQGMVVKTLLSSDWHLLNDSGGATCMTPSGRFAGGTAVLGGVDSVAVLWNELGVKEVLPHPAAPGSTSHYDSKVISVAGEGDLAIVTQTVDGAARYFIWTRANGYLGELHAYLTGRGVNLANWSDLHATDISDDGMTILGRGRYGTPGQPLSLIHWVVKLNGGESGAAINDRDGDGLSEDWELNGIPYTDAEGVFYRYPLPGANPLRKDIYVEIDAMAGQRPIENALARVRAAFDQAPVPRVAGLAGSLPGIALHAEVDEDTLERVTWENAELSGRTAFRPAKAAHFGTVEEREGSEPWALKRAAKMKAYKYCIFAWKLPGEILGHAENDDIEPVAKGGDDFWIGLTGEYATEDNQAATFMHELGHTLGLKHGGGDDYNCKPNYYSVMNYMWCLPGQLALAAPGATLNLDYSRVALPTLDEEKLNETAGIGFPSESPRVAFIVASPTAPPFDCDGATIGARPFGTCNGDHSSHVAHTCMNYAPFQGRVDWNNDGVINPSSSLVCADINKFKMEAEVGLRELHGFDDWSSLKYNHRLSIEYGPNAPGRGSSCITYGQVEYLRSLPAPVDPCPAPAPVLAAPSIDPAVLCIAAGGVTLEATHPGGGPLIVRWEAAGSEIDSTWAELADGQMPSGTGVSGAYGLKLTLSGFSGYDFGVGANPFVRFRARAEDQCGQVVYSPEVSLQVGPKLTAVSPLVAAACPGGSVALTVQAEGVGPFTYEWRWSHQDCNDLLSEGAMAAGTIVSGATSPTVTLSNLSQADFCAGSPFLYASVYDACGNWASGGAFTVHIGGPAFAASPASVDLPCQGSTTAAAFSVHAVGDAPLVHRWMRNGAPIADDVRVHGSTTAVLTIDDPGAADAALYSCTVSNGCGTTTSVPAALNVGPPSSVTQPRPIAMCESGYGTTSVVAVGTQPLAYQWLKDGVPVVDGPSIGGSETAELIVANGPGGGAGVYTCRVTNACDMTLSGGAAVTIETLSVEAPARVAVCLGGTSSLTIAPSYSPTEVSYAWEVRLQDGTWYRLPYDFFLPPPYSACIAVADLYASSMRATWHAASACPRLIEFRCLVNDGCEVVASPPIALKLCAADFNCSSSVTIDDIFIYLNAWFRADPRCDVNQAGGVSIDDIFIFLNLWFTGC